MTTAELEQLDNIAFMMRHHATTCRQRAASTSREVAAGWTGRSEAYEMCAADVEAVIELLDPNVKVGRD